MVGTKQPRRRGHRRLIGWIMVAAVALSACTDSGSPRDGASEPVAQPAPTAAAAGTPEAILTAAGMQIVADETAPVSPAPGMVMLTRVQADRMISELAAGGGLLGADLDALAPTPPGSPPMSYLLAAWLSNRPTPTAQAAHGLTGDRDWRHARQVIFPLAVVSMFVTDFTRPLAAGSRAATESTAPGLTGTAGPSPGAMRPAALTAGQVELVAFDPCADITAFLAKAMKTVFDALKLNPGNSGGLLSFVPWLATVWNIAVDLARGIVEAVVTKLTQPVFDLLRAAIGAAAVATLVVSYFTKQTLSVRLEPATDFRFAVGSEPDISGEFVATADRLTEKWPDALVKCAEVTKKKLPTVLKSGAKATWQVAANDGPVITTGALTGVVGTDLTSRLRFTTGRETAEAAEETVERGTAVVRVEADRPELRELLEEAKFQVRAALNAVLSAVPVPAAVLNAIFDPVLNRIQAEISGRVGGAFTVAGTGSVGVTFHRPRSKPSSRPPTRSTGGGDFCTQYRAMAKWSHDHQGKPTTEAWAAELVSRLTAMRPAAPAGKRGWVDSLLRVYRLVAASAGPAVIGNEVATSGFPAAGEGLAAYCKVDPGLLQVR
ncbi:hypothetical protein GCM10020358_13310 [Amorphoplanes nipponensis]|uniref:Lipoprotein n=3 Tax=Actinoplanes nipponensis TaxID=135950 RepID=A0A919JJX6_9ACTN|nr:hypothetical protein Ani05nite_40850 [Actinoplanes nipponensis]